MANTKNKKTVKFVARLAHITFPASGLGTGNKTYGVTKWKLLEPNENVVFSDEDREWITVIGTFLEPLMPNVRYIIVAVEEENEKYGIQYRLQYLAQDVDLTNPEAQRAFLKGCKLNDNLIAVLYKTFPDPFDVIKARNIAALQTIKGIGKATAERIIKLFFANREMSEIYAELTPFGFTNNFLKRLAMTYHSPEAAIRIVKTNPYDLIYTMDRVGFKIADQVALKLQLDPKSYQRIAAFIFYFLTTQAEDYGNSYVYTSELNNAIYDNLGRSVRVNTPDGSNNIKEAIDFLLKTEKIAITPAEDPSFRKVYLTRIYNLEKEIAQHLIRLKNGPNTFDYQDWETYIELQEQDQGFKFSEEQKAGIKLGLDSQVCIISGLAGSGKSALVAGILSALGGYTFAQCALSGKAAARLQEVTGHTGVTIHKLIMKGPMIEETGEFPCYDQSEPLKYNIVIVDEISMVGGDIFVKLLRALKTGTKLIMLGDPGQLEAIGPLNLAMDMIQSTHIPSVELKTVHRQALESGVLSSAFSVRNQIPLFPNDFYGSAAFGKDKDMLFTMNNRDELRAQVMYAFKQAFSSDIVSYNINNIMVISPVRARGDTCVRNLNYDIQDYYNPIKSTEKDEEILKVGAPNTEDYVEMHAKDKVMCIKNNYHTPFAFDPEQKTAIYNGWVGTIVKVTAKDVYVDFQLADDVVILDRQLAGEILTLGYCATCHKLQGSDAPYIIGVVDYSTPPSMLTNALLYTMITRAKKKCVMVGEAPAFNLAVSQEFVSTKRTFLQEFLDQIDIEY